MICDATNCSNVNRAELTIFCNGFCNKKLHDACAKLPRGWRSSTNIKMEQFINKIFICDTCRDSLPILQSIKDTMDEKFSHIESRFIESFADFCRVVKTNRDQFDMLTSEHQHFSAALASLEKQQEQFQNKINNKFTNLEDALNESILTTSISEHTRYNPLLSEIDSTAIATLRKNLRKDMVEITEALKINIQNEISNLVDNQTLHETNPTNTLHATITTTQTAVLPPDAANSSGAGWRNLYGKRIWKAEWRTHDNHLRGHKQTMRKKRNNNTNSREAGPEYKSAYNDNVTFRTRQPPHQPSPNLIYPAMLKPAIRSSNFHLN